MTSFYFRNVFFNKMILYVILGCLAAVHVDGSNNYNGNAYQYANKYNPQPYSFGYNIKDKESVQYREEAGNGYGVVKGAYGFYDNKGIKREVEYLADKGGFKAKIRTNEPGTAGQAPASVNWYSNDPYAQGGLVPYHSRINVPYLVSLEVSSPKYGFPTINNFQQFSIDKYGQQPYAGYRNPQGIVYFGSNYSGGRTVGYFSRNTQQQAS